MNDYGKKQYVREERDVTMRFHKQYVWDERDVTMHYDEYAFTENKYQHLYREIKQ